MNDAEVLKNFLVRLGWDVDRGGEARFKESVAGATKSIAGLAAGLEAAAVAGALWVHKIASSFESIYYASGRINASVKNINAFRYAVSQLGGSAEGAMASLEAFSRKMREGPGQEAFLKSWGVQTRDSAGRLRESTDLIRDMLASQKFNSQPDFVRLRIAESMGIDERTYRALLQDVDRFTREYRTKLAAAGLDPDVAAKNAQKFEQSWRSMSQSFRMIGDQVATALAGKGGDKLQTFIEFLDKNSGAIARGLVAIGEAIANVATWIAKAIIKFGEWAKEADPWIEKTFGLKNGFEKLAAVLLLIYATRIPALISALSMLVGGPVWKALMIGLGILGVGAAANGLMGNGGENGESPNGGANKDAWYWKLDRWGRKKLGLPPAANDPAGKGGGGSGGGSGGGPASSGGGKDGSGPYKYAKAYELMKKAGATDEEARTMAAIAQAESRGNPNAHNPNPPDNSYGLWQVNMLGRMGPERRAKFGLKSNEDLFDPETNARVALALKRARGNYRDWSTYSDGKYRAYLPREGSEPTYAGRQPGSAMAAPHTGQTPADMRGKVPPPLPGTPGAGMPGAPPWAGGLAPVTPAAPLGSSFGPSGGRGNVEIKQNNTWNVDGARDPGATARAIAGMQSTTNSDMVRNMQGSAH